MPNLRLNKTDKMTHKAVEISGAERYKQGMKTVDFRVEKLPEDPRLDKVIPFHKPEISRNQARALIENGSVYVNKKRCHQNAKAMRLGDQVRLQISEKKEAVDETPPAPLVIFEDKDLIVVNKPPFLPTHETRDTSRYHLALAVQEMLAKRVNKKPADIYLGIHHRLDRDTSGVIVFAKRKEANAPLAQAFQERTVEKTYIALSLGDLPEPTVLKSFIGNHPRNKRLYASVKRDGKYAETAIRALDVKKAGGRTYTMVEAQPKTGRTHQIRVHLAENGLPILGDEAYGVQHPAAKRVMLHAWKLQLLGHTFSAPLPDDFRILDFTDPRA
jgi:23S rRNA pseudouridine1911/1915/1917 synthase